MGLSGFGVGGIIFAAMFLIYVKKLKAKLRRFILRGDGGRD